MIILHDSPSSDLSHIQAIAAIEEGFGLFDYIRIDQRDGRSWIGQVVEPNRNISTVGERLDPTILHGLELMQASDNVQSTASVQVFDIIVLGQYENRQMVTPRLRPLPGATVVRLERDDTIGVIGLPEYETTEEGGVVVDSNAIGFLLNADSVPLCLNEPLFNTHIMLAGGTGSGKSNAAANLVRQAVRCKKCVLIHDAKPDYAYISKENTDKNVTRWWAEFAHYGLRPHPARNVKTIGFHGRCDPNSVDQVVGFRASDFSPEMLASLFFPLGNEEKQFESFASAADALRQEVEQADNPRQSYSLDDILKLVELRADPQKTLDARDQIHESVGKAILRKVQGRRRGMPWMDVIGQRIHRFSPGSPLQRSSLDHGGRPSVTEFNLADSVEQGNILVIDYSRMDEESYALILSYFLRVSQDYRRHRAGSVGLVQLVDEAHRIFDNESRHSASLARSFSRAMREGRSVDHSIIISLQNASQIPSRVMNNLNTKIVMRQNSREEASAATQTMGREFAPQSMKLGTGHALVSVFESRAVVLAQLAPSPYELMRNDNTGSEQAASQRGPDGGRQTAPSLTPPPPGLARGFEEDSGALPFPPPSPPPDDDDDIPF